MTVFNPSYLVKSRHGIWYFQMQIPLKIRKNNHRTLIRRSLRTRDRDVALSRSKFWYLTVVQKTYKCVQCVQCVQVKLSCFRILKTNYVKRNNM